MGITGLLPFVKKATRPAHVREFAGYTAGVDTYCWLHRGAFGCAEQLATGRPTDAYVGYCLRLAGVLRQHGVRPLLVFDGGRLPSKQQTEAQRRQRRQQQRALAVEHLRAGRDRQARECFQRCVDVTPQMALAVIEACRQQNIDCIVAPYEADAQLAYLAQHGFIDLVITEDSDLIVFGCERVLFKMDSSGDGGRLVERRRLNSVFSQFNGERLRLIAVLAGCDYLASLPGVGLARASRALARAANPSWRAVVGRLASYLGLRSLQVPPTYCDQVERALNTFAYQLVFDPQQRRLVPLTPYPAGRTAADYPYAGPELDDATALQVAVGNVDPVSGRVMAHFDVERSSQAAAGSGSVWAVDWTPPAAAAAAKKSVSRVPQLAAVARPLSMHGQTATLAVPPALALREPLSERQLLGIYGSGDCDEQTRVAGSRHCRDSSGTAVSAACEAEQESLLSSPPNKQHQQQPCTVESQGADSGIGLDEPPLSPVVGVGGGGSARRRNPFRVGGAVARALEQRQCADQTSSGSNHLVTSKYFGDNTAPETAATDNVGDCVSSLEQVLRERRARRSLPCAIDERLAFGKRRRVDETCSAGQKPAAAANRTGDWYKMSVVFDPKHSLSADDTSQQNGVRPENSAEASCSPPSSNVRTTATSSALGGKAAATTPPSRRQLNLQQMFGYRRRSTVCVQQSSAAR